MCINYRLRFQRIYIYIYEKKEETANNFCSFALAPSAQHEKVSAIRIMESWNYFVIIIGNILLSLIAIVKFIRRMHDDR